MPDALATDLFPSPWIDQTENAYALSFADGSVSNLILVDVWHHLQYPGTALAEFHRVLGPGGHLIIFDPATGVLGRIVYGRAATFSTEFPTRVAGCSIAYQTGFQRCLRRGFWSLWKNDRFSSLFSDLRRTPLWRDSSPMPVPLK